MEYKKVSKEIYESVKENKKMFEENFKDKLSELFPSTVKDGQVDFKELLEELGEYVDTKERYELTWAGKQNAKKKANEDIVGRTLKYVPEDSKNPETTENLYIEGDNLEVLKLLRNSYYNKIKMIYIDPPYNTGNDFVYNDDYKQSEKETEIEEGDISTDERFIVNQKSNGKYHSNWLNMIYPRLKVAKDMLSDDGVIFISIDDNEVENLRKVCNEVFGENKFITQIPWRKRTAKTDVPFGVSQDFEWIIVYTKANFFAGIPVERKYYKTSDYPNDRWRLSDLTTQKTEEQRPNSAFDLVDPKTGKVYPYNPKRLWGITKDTFKDYYDRGKIVFPDDYNFLGGNIPSYRVFESEDKEKALRKYGTESALKSVSTVLPKEVGLNETGNKDMDSLFHRKVFPFPKPVNLIKYLLNMNVKKNDIILDFFSGSATTAHAVMQLNAEDGGNRKFIMAQTDEEKCDEKSEAYKAGFKNICEIGKERIRRAGKKIKDENKDKEGIENLDVGFKVFKTADTNIRWFSEAINGSLTPLEKTTTDKDKLDFNYGFTDIDVVYEILLRHRDIPLSSKVENLKEIGKRTYMFADAVVVCLENEITEKIVDKIAAIEPIPIKIIFRDSAFGDNISLKENTMIRLEAQIKKNSGIMKKSYRIEFI